MTYQKIESGNPDIGPNDYFLDLKDGANGKYNADGSLKWNNYFRSIYRYHYTKVPTGSWMPSEANFSIIDPLDDPNQYSRTLDKFLVKVNNHSLNLGNDLATMGQTVQMVTDLAKKFTSCVLKLKRGKFADAARVLGVSGYKKNNVLYHRRDVEVRNVTYEDVGSAWLELQYGWKPLLNDLYEVAGAEALETQKPRQYVVSSSTLFADSSSHVDYPLFSWAVSLEKRIKISGLFVEVLDKPRSLGLDDPLSIAWELLPWSFVVDWFIPVGNYLQELHQVPNLRGSFMVSTKSTLISRVNAGSSTVYIGAYNDCRRMDYSRTINSELSVPPPRFKPISKALSLAHMENALALMTQAFSKKVPAKGAYSLI
jgi:hypothetical protein